MRSSSSCPHAMVAPVRVVEAAAADAVQRAAPFLQLPCYHLLPHGQYMLWCTAVQNAPVICPCHFAKSEACRYRTVLCRHSYLRIELCSLWLLNLTRYMYVYTYIRAHSTHTHWLISHWLIITRMRTNAFKLQWLHFKVTSQCTQRYLTLPPCGDGHATPD